MRTATPEQQAIVGRHSDYLESMADQGKVVLAGRCWDGPLGVIVLEAADEAEARAIVDRDPSVSAGLQTAELYPFQVVLERGSRAV